MSPQHLDPAKDDARAAREDALKKLCPKLVYFYNTFLAISPDGEEAHEMESERCEGHKTYEMAQMCADTCHENLVIRKKQLLAQAQAILDAAKKAGLPGRYRIGQIRMVIIKEEVEIMEETHG